MRLSKPQILIIDDDDVTLKVLSAMLRSKGFQVFMAHEAKKGLDLVKIKKQDLVLLDIFLPHIDGWNVLAEIREHDPMKQTPVIMMTSADEMEHENHAIALGASGFLSKPINPTAFNRKIKEVLKREK